MLVFGTTPETLPVTVTRDATTGLPLLKEQDLVLQYVLAYLAIPYSVAEHGCGKKTSLILNRLLELSIPPYALARWLVIERDMSPEALAETDHTKRPHAMISHNPLHAMGDPQDPRFRGMLADACPTIEVRDGGMQVGSFFLHHAPEVQFVIARSHVLPVCWFWDDDAGKAVMRAIDPTLSRDELFEVEQLRAFLKAPESLLFGAPMLGRFRLLPDQMTPKQRDDVQKLLPSGKRLRELSADEHDAMVRELTGAEEGSMGDSAAWTYANNMWGGDSDHDAVQRRRTGRGDAYVPLLERLLAAREAHQPDVHQVRAELRQLTEDSGVHKIAQQDARWSTAQLEPLADAATAIVYLDSLANAAKRAKAGESLLSYFDGYEQLQQARGLGVRLRHRIERLAAYSETSDGEIDARALNNRFARVTLETIRQMNEAGLSVCIDRVGNVHGLLLDERERELLVASKIKPSDIVRDAVVFGSHIDSVKDAGKFDGRLGVCAGIEVLHTLHDLERYYDVPRYANDSARRLLVSAYIGEEMTFTGRGVSMPGSAAVAGRADPSDVHLMENGDGERFGDRLDALLKTLREAQQREAIQLVNDFAGADDASLLDACFAPTEFFTPHSYERHIEQGPVLDRNRVPMAFVGTIMGIHQEDFFFDGLGAEGVALEMNLRMRQLTSEPAFSDVRITVGILEPLGEMSVYERPAAAFRWTMEGEKNHAGATQTPDRRDPGVAAARLSKELWRWMDEHGELKGRGLRPVIGNVHVTPGTNRNVIPGQVAFTIALVGGELSPLEREDLECSLRGYAQGTLGKSVAIGGEGMLQCRVEPISYITHASRARLTIDLRAATQQAIDGFRERTAQIQKELSERFDVGITSAIQQQLSPFSLPQTGQVLIMERSYGGSHNPHETELLIDITRGCVLQLAVARELGTKPRSESLNLYELARSKTPKRWLDQLDLYTSGALHDTCNLAARAAQG